MEDLTEHVGLGGKTGIIAKLGWTDSSDSSNDEICSYLLDDDNESHCRNDGGKRSSGGVCGGNNDVGSVESAGSNNSNNTNSSNESEHNLHRDNLLRMVGSDALDDEQRPHQLQVRHFLQ